MHHRDHLHIHPLEIHPSHLSSLTFLFIYWVCFWKKEVRRSRRGKVVGVSLRYKDWCVEVYRSYPHGPGRIFALPSLLMLAVHLVGEGAGYLYQRQRGNTKQSCPKMPGAERNGCDSNCNQEEFHVSSRMAVCGEIQHLAFGEHTHIAHSATISRFLVFFFQKGGLSKMRITLEPLWSNLADLCTLLRGPKQPHARNKFI